MSYDPSQARDANGKFSSGLQDSLEHQLRTARGHGPERARELAIEIMVAQGNLNPDTGQLTAKGREREAMGRAERRIDRHAKQTGHDPSAIGYQRGRTFVK